MNMRNISETYGENRSIFKFINSEQHGPEAVFWIVVDAFLLVAIVTGNSLSVAIILRTRRRRRHNMKSKFSDPTHSTQNTSGKRKRNHQNEGINTAENEIPDLAPSQTIRPGSRSSSRFVLSLAISDLLVGLSMPFHMVFYIQGADGGGSPLMLGKEDITLGQIEWTCLLRFVLIALACSASACNLLAIAVDRYLAIVYPLHYCRYMTKKVAIAMIISCWGSALVLATVPAYWNRWNTATLCELDDIFTPEYITCVVAPLFGAVVLALTILYWRIGREARSQLKRLLVDTSDGKGPPWKRCQNGKTYSSTTFNASGKNHDKIKHHINGETRADIRKTKVVPNSMDEDENCINQDQDSKDIPKEENEIGSSSKIRKDIDEFKKSNQLNHLQDIEEEQDEKEESSCNYKENEINQNKSKGETNIVKVDNEKYHTDGICIVKCQSDPNLVSYFDEGIVKGKQEVQSHKRLNNELNCGLELSNKTLNSKQSQIFPINNFKKESKQITENRVHRIESGIHINEMKGDQCLKQRKSMDQTYQTGSFNTMPKVMMASKKYFNETTELVISLSDFIKEIGDNFEKNTTGDDKDLITKTGTSTVNPTQKTPKEELVDLKQNNLQKEAAKISSCFHDKPQTFTHREEYQESIDITLNPDFPINENAHACQQDEDQGETEGMDRRASCMRSISSSCSSRGGHRNSTWNIRFPSLTSGTASIRPHVSKSTIVVLLVLGSFILLWLPYLTVSSLLVKGVKLPYTLYRLTFSLAMSNSGVNPIIYGWKNAELKRVFMRFVMSKWRGCRRRWKCRKEQEFVTEILNEHAPSIEVSHIS